MMQKGSVVRLKILHECGPIFRNVMAKVDDFEGDRVVLDRLLHDGKFHQ